MQTKRVALLVGFLALITVGCLGVGGIVKPAAAVYKTPEDAINAYLEGVAKNDTQKVLQACAINEMGEKFQFDLFTERLGGVIITSQLSPTDYPFYVETNKAQLTYQITSRLKILAYSLLSSENVAEGVTLLGMDAKKTAKFMKDVDPKKLSSLKVEEIRLPNKKLMDGAQYQDNADKSARIYGADEQTERVALFSFDGDDYFVGFTLLRYGDSWKISNPISNLANTSAMGAAQKITVKEFESTYDTP